MNWQQNFNQQLDALSAAVMPASVACGTPVGQLECELASLDAIGCAFTQLTLRADRLAGATVDELKQISETLSNRINYLLEPISPIEIDQEGATVQMRSNPPQQNEPGHSYYELFLRRGGSIALYRYEKKTGAIRSRTAATLTHEVLGRLIEDFNTTIDEIKST